MAAGLEIRNNFGSVLIDENYSNLAVSASGTLTFSTMGSQSISIPYRANGLRNPIVALRVTGSGSAGVRSARRNDASLTTAGSIAGTAGATVKWWAFDVPAVVSTSGLQINNPTNGNPIFDSGNQYARVVDDWSPTANAQWEGITRSYTETVRQYAVAFLSPWWYKNGTTKTTGCGGSQRIYIMYDELLMCRVASSTNNFAFSKVRWREGDATDCRSSDPRSRSGQPIFAFLDVTGY